MNPVQLSLIIAVYQRQEELTELLQSLVQQSDPDFEVIIVDDGSPTPLLPIVEQFTKDLNVQYFFKENSGPAQSRNFGMKQATGNYFIFLDSDTIAPKNYIQSVKEELNQNYVDAFGGPDAADEHFSMLQKAISFSMTSFLTTGGIRGGKKQIGKFQPRSFNMGLSRAAFEKTGGFGNLRIGEDPDLSMTLWENGFQTRLFPQSKVFHKRRSSLRKFAKQVYEFGVARPILNQRHPKYKNISFWFPSVFLVGFLAMLLLNALRYPMPFLSFLANASLGLYGFYFLCILIFSSLFNKSLSVGCLSILTTCIQFFGYGYGFLKSWCLVHLFKRDARTVFPTHFSK